MSSYQPQVDDEFSELDAVSHGRHFITFLVDASDQMHANGTLAGVLKYIVSIWKQKAVTGSSDLLAVCFYGTTAHVEGHMDGFFVYRDFHISTKESILELDEIANDTASFKTTYGSKERSDVNYSQIFLAVNAFLMLAEKTVGSRRIVMFSMEDNPAACVDDGVPVIKSVDDVIRKNFKDMLNNGRRIDLYGINRTSSRQFNNELFYKNFMESVQTDADEENNTFTVYSESTSSQVLMRHRFLAKRSLASMKFTIVPDQLVIGIRMYSLVQEATKPKTEYATQDTLDTVKNKTEWRADNEEQTQVHVSKASQKAAEGRTERIQQTQAQKGELKYFFTYGGEKAVFSAEELAQAKSLFEPGLALLGFKPVHYLLPYHNITHSYFIYPDEASVLGSVTAFTALLQSLANLNQIAICRMQARKASTPRLVALCPQTEVRDNKGVQLKPPGLNVVVLPYADDIRSVPHTPTPTADPELVKHMTNIAMGMKEDFTCSIRNPRLHRYYDMLEATALEYEEMPETPDLTLPNPEKFALFDSDFEAIDSSYPDVEGEKPTIHRKKVIATADEDEEEAPKKKKKSARSRADESGDDSEEEPVKKKRKPASSEGIDVKDFWRKTAKLTAPQLKEFLKSVGLSVKGLTAELVERGNEHFDCL